MIVVDTNVLVYLLVGGPGHDAVADRFRHDPEWAAPALLLSELRNVLVGLVRRHSLDRPYVHAIQTDAIEVLGDRVLDPPASAVLDVAFECGLTAYDAEFVALARALDVPLLSADEEILRGAPDVAVAPG